MSYEISTEDLPEQHTIVLRARLRPEELGSWLSEAYGHLFAHLEKSGFVPAGPPYARYAFNGAIGVEAGVPVPAGTPVEGTIEKGRLPAVRAATTIHRGSYDRLGAAYAALEKWIEEHGHVRNGAHWEVYLTGPSMDPADLRTIVVMPLLPGGPAEGGVR